MINMGELLIQNVRPVGGKAGESVDLLIRDGVIVQIGAGLTAGPGAAVWQAGGAWVSAGWMDVGTHSGDPGFEFREDLDSVCRAAAAGGFTAIALFPNTHPAIHGKSEVLYVRNKTAGQAVAVYPIGAVSHDCAGKDMAELYDMHAAGAVAFSDGRQPVQDAGLLLRAMQYVRAFDGLVMNQPHHKSIASGGQMHEGLMSTRLGMKGIPALAEELVVQRDLSLLEYAQGRLHLHLLSAAKSVELVRQAKKRGLPVTCSVAVANLCFTDEQLATFNSQWKVLPPLRSENDRLALLEGLADGTIDFICSNHTPWDEEAKNLEYPYAEFGMACLETAFSLCRTYLADRLSLDMLVEKWATAPRRTLGLPQAVLAEAAPADLTLFLPDAEWTVGEKPLQSKAYNNPFAGQKLKGKVLGIVRGERVFKS